MLERLLSEVGHRVRALIRRRSLERELEEELAFHLERETEKLVGRGLSRAEAAREARIALGGVERIKDASRDVRGLRWLDAGMQDVRHAVRQLVGNPGFTIVVVVTLALGIGANSALFTLLDRLFFRLPAGIEAPGELLRLYRIQPPSEGNPGFITPGFPYPAIENIASVLPAGYRIATWGISPRPLGRDEAAPRVVTVTFGPRYFDVLGVRAALGRLPTAEEARIDAESMVALISRREWETRYGSDPGVLGRQVELWYRRYTIIGVLPGDFAGLDEAAAGYWIPLGSSRLSERAPPIAGSWNYGGTYLIARASESGASERMAALASEVVGRGAPGWLATATVTAASIKAARGPQKQPAELGVATRLAAVSGILLLIAIANVANLGIARAARRRAEIAVRLSLGIPRARLVAMLMVETLLLSALAAAAALLVAGWGGGVLRTSLFPDTAWQGSPVDVRVALFTLAVAVGAGMLAGLPPALRAGRFGLATALKAGAREGTDARSRLRSTLVAAQVGLSVILLIGAGAFVRSLSAVTAIDPGFDADRLALVSMRFNDLEPHSDVVRAGMPRVVERLRSLPQVEAVAEANWRPLTEYAWADLYDEAGTRIRVAPEVPSYQFVSPNFFDVMGIPLASGRVFREDERDPDAPLIVINRAMAASLWPGRSPLGECIRVSKADSPCARVIGVVENAHRADLIEPEPVAQYYRSLRQSNETAVIAVVRAQPHGLGAVAAAAREAIRQDLPEGAFPDVQPLANQFSPETRPWRLGAAIFSSLGLLALLVATIGTYSVVAFLVHQRRHELGVRAALGAGARQLAQLVVADAVRMVGLGVLAGLAGAYALGGLLESLLYHASPHDPATLMTVAAVLMIAAMIAALLPAWRATRAQPLDALRAE